MRFAKYHGLGNDYVVLEPAQIEFELTPERIRGICHRNYGVGSDGILLGPISRPDGRFGLRIFNPDGSEAEKSGNGLRIFARYLWDKKLVGGAPFAVHTIGGTVEAQVHEGGASVTVEMGRVSFDSTQIPVTGPAREVIDESITLAGREFRYCAATIGNPHCIILCGEVLEEDARRYGPLIENDPRFPNRTNVQFMKVLNAGSIRIEIWERGAGYTLASGSSSCAAAAVARRIGACGPTIAVHMPGGVINVSISDDYDITMTGPVTKVCEGDIADEAFR